MTLEGKTALHLAAEMGETGRDVETKRGRLYVCAEMDRRVGIDVRDGTGCGLSRCCGVSVVAGLIGDGAKLDAHPVTHGCSYCCYDVAMMLLLLLLSVSIRNILEAACTRLTSSPPPQTQDIYR